MEIGIYSTFVGIGIGIILFFVYQKISDKAVILAYKKEAEGNAPYSWVLLVGALVVAIIGFISTIRLR